MIRYCIIGAALLAVIVFGMSLGGCAAVPPPEPQIIPKPYPVPVPVTCVPMNVEPTPPEYPDAAAAIAAGDVQKRAQLVTAANLLLHQRNDMLEQILKACLNTKP